MSPPITHQPFSAQHGIVGDRGVPIIDEDASQHGVPSFLPSFPPQESHGKESLLEWFDFLVPSRGRGCDVLGHPILSDR